MSLTLNYEVNIQTRLRCLELAQTAETVEPEAFSTNNDSPPDTGKVIERATAYANFVIGASTSATAHAS